MSQVHAYPIILFWSEEDEGFIADIPDLRYCSAFGDTPEKALAEVLVARDLYLRSAQKHGDPLPTPTAGPAIVAAARQLDTSAVS